MAVYCTLRTFDPYISSFYINPLSKSLDIYICIYSSMEICHSKKKGKKFLLNGFGFLANNSLLHKISSSIIFKKNLFRTFLLYLLLYLQISYCPKKIQRFIFLSLHRTSDYLTCIHFKLFWISDPLAI